MYLPSKTKQVWPVQMDKYVNVTNFLDSRERWQGTMWRQKESSLIDNRINFEMITA